MSGSLQFVVEAACALGVVLLAALATCLVGNRPMTRSSWLRFGVILVAALVWLAAFGDSTAIFNLVIGASLFVGAVVGIFLAAAYGWRLLRRRPGGRVERAAATNFAGAVLWGVAAVASLALAIWCIGGWIQDSGHEQEYAKALACATPSSSCVEKTTATVVEKWAEAANGPHWVSVTTGNRTRNIQLETAYNVWDSLTAGQSVQLSWWRGQVTEVSVAGVGTMQTSDSPQFGGFLFAVFTGVSLLAFLIFLGGAIFYGLQCWAILKGWRIPDSIAA